VVAVLPRLLPRCGNSLFVGRLWGGDEVDAQEDQAQPAGDDGEILDGVELMEAVGSGGDGAVGIALV
jgi:hypothetical protein